MVAVAVLGGGQEASALGGSARWMRSIGEEGSGLWLLVGLAAVGLGNLGSWTAPRVRVGTKGEERGSSSR